MWKNIMNVFAFLFLFTLFEISFGYEIAVYYQPSDSARFFCPEDYLITGANCSNYLYEFINKPQGFHFKHNYTGGEWQYDKAAWKSTPTNPVYNWRVPRAYPERYHWVNGQSKLINVWDPTDVGLEIDLMKQAGVDHVIFLTAWQRNPDYFNGFSGYKDEINTFINVNAARDPSQRVKFSFMFTTDRGLPNDTYTGNSLYDMWRDKIHYALNHSKTYSDYYFVDGKPMITFFDTGSFLIKLKQQGYLSSIFRDLISYSNYYATSEYGYSGIHWVDSSSTIVTWSHDNSQYTVQNYKDYQDIISYLGFSAGSGWIHHGMNNVQFTSYKGMIESYETIWGASIDRAEINGKKYYPPLSPGWDARAVGENPQPSDHDRSRSCDGSFDSDKNTVATGNPYPYGCSPNSMNSLFATMLRKAKVMSDSHAHVTNGMFIVGTWNDVGEYTNLIPTVSEKGALSRVLYNVFKSDNTQPVSVYFGKGSKWVTKVVLPGQWVTCNGYSTNGFGTDPAPGVGKECRDQFGSKIIDEGYSNSFPASNFLQVRFGVPGSFLTAQLPLGTYFTCSYNAFGGDPAPGQVKSCFTEVAGVLTTLAPEGWVFYVR